MPENIHRYGTKRYWITEAARQGESWRDLYSRLRVEVENQREPWVFKANANVRGMPRVSKSLAEQYVDLKNEIRRVYAAMGRDITGMQDEKIVVSVPDAPVTQVIRASGKASKDKEKQHFFSEWKRVRQWIKNRAATTGGSEIDSLDTMRPVNEARKGINEGISSRALLSAMTLHWSKDSRQSAGIEEIDFNAISEPVREGMHHLSGYVVKLMAARIPIMLVGPAGTGKSTIVKQCADFLGVPYAETPLTAGATPSWLLGRQTFPNGQAVDLPTFNGNESMQEIGAAIAAILAELKSQTTYQISHFLEIYSGGGVFNLEEIDAADPNMLIVVNNALAQNEFYNPVNGEVYVKHPDFIAASTANTFGVGANSSYTGRERLDLATIDRFRMGRVTVDLDEALAERLMFA